MVRLRRGRENPSLSNLQHYPEFFKIYLPELNSKTLSIPPAFIENFKGNIPKKVILKNSLGKYWHVESEEIGGKLLINKGWEGFVSSHSLVRGEFLIFQYNGNGMFTVKIFGLNGCKKDETTVNSCQLEVKVEKGAKSEQLTSDRTDACEQKHPERMVENKNSPDSQEAMTCIRFSKVLENKRLYEMGIPSGIIIENKINPPKVNLPETIILRNQKGDSLSVTFRQRPDRRVEMARGWRYFCLYNHIAHGDELEFEIILDKQRKVREIVALQVKRKRRRNCCD